MPTIDLGVDFSSVKDMDKFPVLPAGSAQFYVEQIETVKTGPNSKTPGRPMLNWTLVFAHPDTGQKCPLTWRTVLPWIPPGTQEIDVSGCGNLVAVCKATGKPWAGSQINTDEYLNVSGSANVVLKRRQIKQPDGTYADSADTTDNVNDFDQKNPFNY